MAVFGGGFPGGAHSHRLATHSAIRRTRLPGARGRAPPARYALHLYPRRCPVPGLKKHRSNWLFQAQPCDLFAQPARVVAVGIVATRRMQPCADMPGHLCHSQFTLYRPCSYSLATAPGWAKYFCAAGAGGLPKFSTTPEVTGPPQLTICLNQMLWLQGGLPPLPAIALLPAQAVVTLKHKSATLTPPSALPSLLMP
jgi:hypothetical protein